MASEGLKAAEEAVAPEAQQRDADGVLGHPADQGGIAGSAWPRFSLAAVLLGFRHR